MSNKDQVNRFAKLWLMEASTYSFSINLSMGFINALMIKILGYTPLELGYLLVLRILAVAISQPFASFLLMYWREKRKLLWLIGGVVNRVGWALPLIAIGMPRTWGFTYLSSLLFVTQFLGGVAGVAAMDTIGDNISVEHATKVFSKMNKYAYISITLSQITGIIIFLLPIDAFNGYIFIYILALLSAILSSILLYKIPDHSMNMSLDYSRRGLSSFKKIVIEPALRKYLAVISIFNFAINIPAPFWDYIVLSLGNGLDLLIPLKNLASLLTKILTLDMWRRFFHKYGFKKTLVNGIALTSIIPVLYIEATHTVDILIAEAISGVVWAPIDVGINIYNIYLPGQDVRPAYLTAINLLSNAISTLAAASGTTIYAVTGNIYSTLIASAVLRVFTASIAYKELPDIKTSINRDRDFS